MSTRPLPSHRRIFSLSPRFERKITVIPECGSSPSSVCTIMARALCPHRKSTGRVAIMTRKCCVATITKRAPVCGSGAPAARPEYSPAPGRSGHRTRSRSPLASHPPAAVEDLLEAARPTSLEQPTAQKQGRPPPLSWQPQPHRPAEPTHRRELAAANSKVDGQQSHVAPPHPQLGRRDRNSLRQSALSTRRASADTHASLRQTLCGHGNLRRRRPCHSPSSNMERESGQDIEDGTGQINGAQPAHTTRSTAAPFGPPRAA
ncbi:hypothetical protein LA6_003948 [Marinibacterium anthonyi]|nr:hypothetical protein LA6_003948 [Marinibacterium anthonyi]